MQNFLIIIVILFSFSGTLSGVTFKTSIDTIEVFLLDSFVTPEEPHRFRLTFITSDDCKSKVLINGKYEYTVSDEYKSSHSFILELNGLQFEDESVPFIIFTEDENGNKFSSDKYNFILPSDFVFEKSPNLLVMCLGGGIVAALPAPTFVYNDKSYFGISKELPLITYFKGGYNYPVAYFSVEYTHVFKAERKNFLRAGLKKIFELPYVEYVSPGLSITTDFNGYYAFSPEVSFGLFKLLDVFTVYARYRYNYQLKTSSDAGLSNLMNDGTTQFFKPAQNKRDYQDLSIGLFYSFFTKQIRL